MSSSSRDFNPSRRSLLAAMGAAALVGSTALPSAANDSTQPAQPSEGVFNLGDVRLEYGTILKNAKLAYKTHGQLNVQKTNAILYPTQFAAQRGDIEWLIGPGKALNPDTHFIIVLDQFGNGLSSSPKADWIRLGVRCSDRLLGEALHAPRRQ